MYLTNEAGVLLETTGPAPTGYREITETDYLLRIQRAEAAIVARAAEFTSSQRTKASQVAGDARTDLVGAGVPEHTASALAALLGTVTDGVTK